MTTSIKDKIMQVKPMVIPLVAFTITILVSFVIIVPWTKEVFSLKEKIDGDRKDLNDNSLPKLVFLQSQDPSVIKNYLLTMEILVPESSNVPEIFNTLEVNANQFGLKTSNLSYSGSLEVMIKKEVRLSFSVNGSQDSLLQFVSHLKDVSPLLSVGKLSVTSGEGSDNSTANLTISSPYWSIPTRLGSAVQPIASIGSNEKTTLERLEETFLKPLLGKDGVQITPTPLPSGKENPF